MKYTGALLFVAIGFAVVEAFSISGGASINKTGASAAGSLIFPRIPGFNIPLSSIFGIRTTTPSSNNGGTNSSNDANSTSTNNNNTQSLKSGLVDSFDLPDPQSLIPDLSSTGDAPIGEPSLSSDFMDPTQTSSIPGVAEAIEEAREHVTQALQLGSNFTAGIEQAIQDAFASDDPTSALRTMVQTIIDAYVTVAENCPLIVVGSRVLQEGIRLAMEVGKSVQNVIFGSTSVPL